MDKSNRQFSNFVTPPDFVSDKFNTVTLVDATPEQVDVVALYCQGCDVSFNVYLYNVEMNDTVWLEGAVEKSDAVIINTDPNDWSPVKDKLVIADNAFYYGPKNFLMDDKRLNSPVEYFIGVVYDEAE